MNGVVRTRVGYLGAEPADRPPNYNDLRGTTETVEIEFDPAVVSLEEVFGVFFRCHNPRSRARAQYMSALFVRGPEQERAARAAVAAEEARAPGVTTLVAQVGDRPLTVAEDYHNKYMLTSRYKNLTKAFAFATVADLVDSPAAARANAFVAGHGTLEQALREVPTFGLPADAEKELLDICRRRLK